MSTAAYGVIEILMFFGGILAFCWYQLRSIRKSREDDGSAGDAGDAAGTGTAHGTRTGRSREDIFWDTISKKR